jgi:hypothetical protein
MVIRLTALVRDWRSGELAKVTVIVTRHVGGEHLLLITWLIVSNRNSHHLLVKKYLKHHGKSSTALYIYWRAAFTLTQEIIPRVFRDKTWNTIFEPRLNRLTPQPKSRRSSTVIYSMIAVEYAE